MFEIKDKTGLELAYELLSIAKEPEKIIDIKRSIRGYFHKQNLKQEQTKMFGDCDGYTELIPVPAGAVIYKEEWFENQIRKIAVPSQYDCTGQHFTIGHRFVHFRNRLYCIHNVGLDV